MSEEFFGKSRHVLFVYYHQLKIIFGNFFRPITSRFRSLNRKKYEQWYEERMSHFPVGSVVRITTRLDEGSIPVYISPAIQESGILDAGGKADDRGYKLMREPLRAVGTVPHAFYDAKDPFIVVAPKLTKEEFVKQAILYGYFSENSQEDDAFTLLIRPQDESKITWPKNGKHGRNILEMYTLLLERV